MHQETKPTSFADEIALVSGGESMRACYACGTCVSRCIIPWRDPAYNPRRVFHKAIMGMRQAVFEDATIWYCTACDLCYAACPQDVHISDVIVALRHFALEAGCTSPLETVLVNPILCSGCGSCVDICPYEALSLADQVGTRISTVDHNRCMGCGSCIAACPTSAIGGGSFADEHILDQLAEGLQSRAWQRGSAPGGEPRQTEVDRRATEGADRGGPGLSADQRAEMALVEMRE